MLPVRTTPRRPASPHDLKHGAQIGRIFGYSARNVELRTAIVADAGSVVTQHVIAAGIRNLEEPVRAERRRFDNLGNRLQAPDALGAHSSV